LPLPAAEALLHPRPEGLYCPPGDFFIDPLVPVERALITHAHSDHARAGHGHVLATADTLAIMALRYGDGFAGHMQPIGYGEAIAHNGVAIRFHPAGHVLGSAQIELAWRGLTIVVSGDYKRVPDPTVPPFAPVRCHVFVSEATFGLPVFRHPPADGEIAKLLRSVAQFPGRAHLVGAYALGKAQRLMALLHAAGWQKPIWIHGALARITEHYRDRGIALGDVRPVGDLSGADFAGAVILCPPGALAERWSRRFPDPVHVLASGWMRIRARARQRGAELPLVVSDHADWDELRRTVRDTGAEAVWVTHGAEDALVHWCRSQHLDARPLRLVGYGDEETEALA
jgi:putative mRNA 3-end processing factor